MINRSEIFRKAWADYRIRRLGVFAAGDENGRRFIRAMFAKSLTAAWAEAKTKAAAAIRARETEETARRFVAAQHRSRVEVCAAWTPQQRSARIAAIRDELTLLDYAPWGIRVSDKRATLNDELAAIEAASLAAAEPALVRYQLIPNGDSMIDVASNETLGTTQRDGRHWSAFVGGQRISEGHRANYLAMLAIKRHYERMGRELNNAPISIQTAA